MPLLLLRQLSMIHMLRLPCSLVGRALATISTLVLLGDVILPELRSLAMHELSTAMRLQVRRLVPIVGLHQHGN